MNNKKIINNWLDFGLSFLEIANLACDEMKNDKSNNKVSDLYIATIYNVKHGIEVLLKSTIVVLEDKELIKKDETHDQKVLFTKICNIINLPDIKRVIDEVLEDKKNVYFIFLSEKTKSLGSQFISMGNLIHKYQHLEFLNNKIENNYVIEDCDNTTFKYPQNSLKIKLDYKEILKRIKKEDLDALSYDINKLINIFISLYLIIERYTESKKNGSYKHKISKKMK